MKYLFLIITLFNLPAFGSCLVKIENGDKSYHVTIWKHTEGQDDTVVHKSFSEKELSLILLLVNQGKGLRLVFNEGVFTSMKYLEGSTKKWAQLSRAEKDMVFYLQEKFDVTEK